MHKLDDLSTFHDAPCSFCKTDHIAFRFLAFQIETRQQFHQGWVVHRCCSGLLDTYIRREGTRLVMVGWPRGGQNPLGATCALPIWLRTWFGLCRRTWGRAGKDNLCRRLSVRANFRLQMRVTLKVSRDGSARLQRLAVEVGILLSTSQKAMSKEECFGRPLFSYPSAITNPCRGASYKMMICRDLQCNRVNEWSVERAIKTDSHLQTSRSGPCLGV